MKLLLRTLLVLAPMALSAQGIVGSKHDLSTKYGNVDGQVCIFCHTPHQATASIAGPLWNHSASTATTYTTYTNTAGVTAGQPGTMSVACLSCHDGTVAVGSIINNGGRGNPTWTAALPGYDATGILLPANVNYVGTDLSNDHPVGVVYPTTGTKFVAVASLVGPKLYGGNVECASCHRVHTPTFTPFLRMANTASALCVACHIK
ncbi:MAG: cytochrome C [Holophagaceae bacterium]|nr:cytochrome C [Holophagaceae bacterium]